MDSTGVRTLRFATQLASSPTERIGPPRLGRHRQARGRPRRTGDPLGSVHLRISVLGRQEAQAAAAWQRQEGAGLAEVRGFGRRAATGAAATTGPGPTRRSIRAVSPKPITAYQIWNEPNLPKFFPRKNGTRKYAKLVKIAHRAINGVDRRAKVVLAGLIGYRETDRLDLPRQALPRQADQAQLRRRRPPSVRGHHRAVQDRDQAHPRGDEEAPRRQDRAVADGGRLGIGPDTRRFPLNKGTQGQKRMLRKSFKLVLNKRRAWHVQRLFWFHWRDPARGDGAYCSFCPSAGLLRHNHKPKPAYRALQTLHAGVN